jgi:hypothetical protein
VQENLTILFLILLLQTKKLNPMKGSKLSIGISLFLMLLFSCVEEKVSPLKVSSADLTGTITPQAFDWETVDYLPTGSDVSILLPWAGGNGLFDPQITYDFKRADGWKMVYNTFRTDQLFQNGSYFALYNKYRGVLRFYFYIRPNNNFASTYLEENFRAYSPTGKTTSFWNFVDREIVDPASNSMQSRKIKNFAVPSEGAWYVSEFDVAYDPNLKNLNYNDIWLLNDLKFWNVQQTVLTGKITGTAEEVSVQTPSPFTIDNLLAGGPLKIAGALSSLNKSTLNAAFKTEVGKVKTNGATAIVKGISNLIMTGNPLSGSTQSHFKIDLTANFSGTNTSGGALKQNFKIAMPCTSNATSGDGPVPFDNDPMGVYNLTARPTVYVKMNGMPAPLQCLAPYGMSTHAVEYTFFLDDAFLRSLSPSYTPNVFNPKFLEVANISQGWTYYWAGYGAPGPKVEILVSSYNPACPNGVQIVGKKDCTYIPDENVAGFQVKNITPSKNGTPGAIVGNGFFRNDTPVYIRITFDVIPKDGSPKTTIIKTFKCNVSPFS